MDFLQSYFPTPRLKKIELRFDALLGRELRRLDAMPEGGVFPENLAGQLVDVRAFCSSYHALYMEYLDEVLPQHREPVRCGAGCGNCCHHFPMSVEPFELIHLYAGLRERADFAELLESCFVRVRRFGALQDGEDEEALLHSYFSQRLPCPFIRASGDCGIYALRPLTCRMYFSHTDPRFCTSEHLQTPANRSFIVYLPDAIEEKIAEVSMRYAGLELPESLYGGLIATNTLEGFFPHGD